MSIKLCSDEIYLFLQIELVSLFVIYEIEKYKAILSATVNI